MLESEGRVTHGIMTTPFGPRLAMYMGCHDFGANYAKSHHDKISEL